MPDYKFLCQAVTIFASLVNLQTHRHIDSIFTRLYEQLSQLSFKSIQKYMDIILILNYTWKQVSI